VAGLLAAVVAASAVPATAQVAVRGGIVHTMAGDPIENGVVVIRDGTIAAVGPAGEVEIPDGFEVLEAAVVTPGLVDAHTVVGLAGQYNYDHDQDQLERSEPMQPQLRAIDAYNTRERLVEWVRSFGVTTIHTGHAPGEVISGQTMIVKTAGNTVDDAVVVPVAMVAASLDQSALKGRDGSPGTRSKMVSLLRQKLVEADEYRRRRAAAPTDDDDDDASRARDLGLEVLVRALDGDLPLLVTAHRAQDIANALRIAEEFDLRLVLDGGAESYLLAGRIHDAGVPVIVHPTMMRAWEQTENASFETASRLADAGIPVALQSGYEDYVPKTRVVLFEAALAAVNGLGFERALATITIDAARILGVADRVGSLEVGKDGDVALYDGDPFEYTSHCVGVVIEGDVVSTTVR
jgi:imidazolonepropionase-like amidohydrolase